MSTDRPAMPDPRREVGRAVTHLIRSGLTAHEAAQRIVNVTVAVQAQLRAVGLTENTWVHELWVAACVLEAGTAPEVGREDDTDSRPASEIAVGWARDAVRVARQRGVIGDAEG